MGEKARQNSIEMICFLLNRSYKKMLQKMNQKSTIESINKEAGQRQNKRKSIFSKLDNKQKESQMAVDLSKKYIQLSSDSIGLRLLCKSCGKIYYYFQFPDHYQLCQKKQQQNKGKLSNDKYQSSEKVKDQRLYHIQKLQQISIEEKKEEDDIQSEKQEMDFNNSLLELEKFESKKIQISRIVEKQQKKIESTKQKDQFTEVPCPFCVKILQLTQLDHIDKCLEGKKCKYCHDKYPISLYSFHLTVCRKNNQKKMWQKTIFKGGKKQEEKILIGKKISFQDFKREFHQKEMKEERQIKPRIAHTLPVQRINGRQLEQMSRIRHQNLTGLPKDQINKIEQTFFIPDNNNKESKDCAICSFDFQIGDSVNKLPCEHMFHGDCLLPWLQERSTCPTCKARIAM